MIRGTSPALMISYNKINHQYHVQSTFHCNFLDGSHLCTLLWQSALLSSLFFSLPRLCLCPLLLYMNTVLFFYSNAAKKKPFRLKFHLRTCEQDRQSLETPTTIAVLLHNLATPYPLTNKATLVARWYLG